MTVKMADIVGGDKVAVVESPTYVITPNESSELNRRGIQKKHVLIVVGLVILAGLIIAGILVGVYIFAEAQKDIVKFSLNSKTSNEGENVKQEVESDPNDNVVQYHLTLDKKDVYIVNDFNRDIQVVKMQYGSAINCYVAALNRSATLSPLQITGPEQDTTLDNTAKTDSAMFTVSSSPISDRSFLPKKAQTMCKGLSVYWAYRSCNYENTDKPVAHDRQRRWTCRSGCGYTVCSCSVTMYYYYLYGQLRCRFYFGC
jgi:hypothetical protein